MDAPEHVRNLNDIVYMADCLIYSEQDRFDLQTINTTVLNRHNLKSPEELQKKFEHLSTGFDANNLWK